MRGYRHLYGFVAKFVYSIYYSRAKVISWIFKNLYFQKSLKITGLTKKNTLLFLNVNFGTTGYTFKSKIFYYYSYFLLLYRYT